MVREKSDGDFEELKKPKQGYKLVNWLFGKEIEIPKDWELVKFGDFSKIGRGASPRPIQDPKYFGNGRGWIRISDVSKSHKYLEKTRDYLSKEGESESVAVNEGDVIMSIAATVGRPIILKMKACIHDGFIVFAKLSKEINNEFLYYLLKQLETSFSNMGQHGTQSNINSQLVSSRKFVKPSLPEQEKIVSILNSVDELLFHIKKSIVQTNKLKIGLMQQLLTRGIGHTKFKKIKWYFGKEIEIPEEWELKKIKELSKVSVGLVINPSTYFDDDGTIPMITGKHVTENGIVLNDVDFITEKSNELLETTRIWSGDLVTMRVGYPGRTSVVRDEHNGINCASVIITRKSKKIVSDFFGHLSNSKLISKQIMMHQAGGAQQVVNVGSWKEFLIFSPPLSEQQKIATILSNVDSKIHELKSKKTNLENLKKDLMQKLLTGQIRVAA